MSRIGKACPPAALHAENEKPLAHLRDSVVGGVQHAGRYAVAGAFHPLDRCGSHGTPVYTRKVRHVFEHECVWLNLCKKTSVLKYQVGPLILKAPAFTNN